MVRHYKLKLNPLDKNRLSKQVKLFLDNIDADRDNALDAFKYFKGLVDANSEDADSKSAMVECLKVASTSQNNGVKLLSFLLSIEQKTLEAGGKSEKSGFDDFNKEED